MNAIHSLAKTRTFLSRSKLPNVLGVDTVRNGLGVKTGLPRRAIHRNCSYATAVVTLSTSRIHGASRPSVSSCLNLLFPSLLCPLHSDSVFRYANLPVQLSRTPIEATGSAGCVIAAQLISRWKAAALTYRSTERRRSLAIKNDWLIAAATAFPTQPGARTLTGIYDRTGDDMSSTLLHLGGISCSGGGVTALSLTIHIAIACLLLFFFLVLIFLVAFRFFFWWIKIYMQGGPKK